MILSHRHRLCFRLMHWKVVYVLSLQFCTNHRAVVAVSGEGFHSLLIQECPKPGPKAPAFVIVGDSTVDVGVNNYLLTVVKSDFLPYGRDFPFHAPTGRFCNGKLIADFVAEKLGLPYPLPYLHPNAKGSAILQGINTASSGSGYFDLTAIDLNVKTLPRQIEWIKEWQRNVQSIVGNATAASITSEAIFALSTGSNDWINNYYNNPILRLVFNTNQYIDFLLGLVRLRLLDLYNLGARRIAVVSLPPLGCLPAVITEHGGGIGCIESVNNDSTAFNIGLEAVIKHMNQSLKGITIVYIDSYTVIFDAFHNPKNYGIKQKETFRGCCGSGLFETGPFCNELTVGTCENADEFLFWDAFHPTEFVNRHIADAFYATFGPAMGLNE